jgi:DNA-binding NarL/FixJ family response regulator
VRRPERDNRTAAAAQAGVRARVVHLAGRDYVLLSFPRESGAPDLGLTESEQQVASALLAGLSNAAIARLRGAAERTVANQVASIYRKLGVRSRAELTARWGRLLAPAGPG